MAPFTRTLKFRTMQLGADATLMLTFNEFMQGMYQDKFPVCWKVTKFPKNGPYEIMVTYESQLAFSKPQVDHANGTIISAGTYQKINIGQRTSLIKDTNGVFQFTAPKEEGGNTMKAFNDTEYKEDLTVGFLQEGAFLPTSILYFEGVGVGNFIQAQFTPVLRAYINTGYKETQIIKGEIGTPVLFKEDLAALPETTIWNVSYDHATGKFSITRA